MSKRVESYTINVDGVDWRYHCVGRGELTLLLLSGSLGASEGTARLIGESLPSVSVIVLEYAPVGTMKECLDAIGRILEAEGAGKHAVYGGSFGGFIAQCWCRKDPGRITHMILSGAGGPDARRVRKNQKALRLLPLQPMSVARLLVRFLLWVMFRKTVPHAAAWKSEYELLIARLTNADLLSRYKVAIDFDSHYRFLPASVPQSVRVLILEGENDRLANKTVREELRSLYPDAQTHVFARAGHSAMMTHSDEWSRIVSAFLGR